MYNYIFFILLIFKTYYYFLTKKEIYPAIKFSFIWPLLFLNFTINYIFLSLDHIFFSFKNIEVREPLFILGFPRSGTTFIHKILYKDPQFTTPLLWELLFAPSIIQKKIFWKIKHTFNLSFNSMLPNILKKILKKFDHIHPIHLSNPEEDYLSLMPYGACFLLIVIMPIENIWKLIDFDKNHSQKTKSKLMSKYKNLIKRHLYIHGANKKYLSKNPYFTSFIDSINHTFPNSNIIGCYRNPKESVPSLLNNMKEAYTIISRNIKNDDHIIKYIYMYKNYSHIMQKKEKECENFILLKHSQIKHNLFESIENIYKKFNYDFDKKFKNFIKEKDIYSKKYTSKHNYSLIDFNITPEYIDNIFK